MTLFGPGSFLWLVRHEVRIAWRGRSKGPTTRLQALAARAPLLLLAIVPTVIGIGVGWVLRRLPDAPSPKVLAVVSMVFAGLFLLMTFRAASQVIRSFIERGDLDLLLGAPLPPGRILGAKAVGVYASVGLPFVILFAPFLLTSAILGHPRWLGVLAMIGVTSVLATSTAFVAARLLTRALGVRRARVIMQVGGAVLGALAFLLSQAFNLAPQASEATLRSLRTLPAPLDWPAKAAFASPLLLGFIGIASAAAWGATRFAAANFGASEETRVTAAARPPRPFRSGLTATLVRKELRLLARDTETLTQVLLRLVYLVPVVLLIFRGDPSGVFPGPRLAAAGTVFAGMLAASLAWLTVCAEDAADLIDAAPVRAAAVRRAKLIAACAPSVVIVVLAALGLATRDRLAALALLVCGCIAALTGALLQAWFGTPAPRSNFRRRQQGSIVLGVGELVLAASWSGVAALLARGSLWALAPGLLAATILAGADAARRAPPPPASRARAGNAIGRLWKRRSTA